MEVMIWMPPPDPHLESSSGIGFAFLPTCKQWHLGRGR